MAGFLNPVGPSPAPQSRRALEMRLRAGGARSLAPQLSPHLPPDPDPDSGQTAGTVGERRWVLGEGAAW